MPHIDVTKTLDAPIEHVFEMLSDHAAYAANFRGVKRSVLTREGTAEPNGVGAVRAITSGPLSFEEQITAFERPTRMDYLIVKVNAPIVHEGGSIRLEPDGERTRVHWTSTFSVSTPVVAGPLGATAQFAFAQAFKSMLNQIEARYSPDPVPAPTP
jgi:carbon monoxide dehydrogenase subunit G